MSRFGSSCTLLLLALGLLHPLAMAQQPQAEPLPPAFIEIASSLIDVPGITLGRPNQRRLPAPIGPQSYGFYEHLPGHQLLLTMKLSTITQPQAVVKVLDAVKEAVSKQCTGKQLRYAETARCVDKVVFGQPSDLLMTATVPLLYERELIGRLDCLDADGRLQASTKIEWDQGERDPSEVIPPDVWRFRIESISADRLIRQSIRFEDFKRQTDALRSRLTPGAHVQLSIADIPTSIADRLPRPFNPARMQYFVCALVTQGNGQVAEVQVDQARFMVQTLRLLPGGVAVTAAELGVQIELKNPLYRACLRA